MGLVAHTRDVERNGWTNLHFLLAKRDFADNLQTRGLVWFRVDQVLGFKNVFVLLTVGWRSAHLVAELVGSRAQPRCFRVHVSTFHRVSEMLNTRVGMEWLGGKQENLRGASAFLASERLVIDIWGHLIRDCFWRVHKKRKVRRDYRWTGASANERRRDWKWR